MPTKKNELKVVLKLGVKTLILQEVRLLRLEQTFTPHIVIDEMSQSIRDTKREIVRLVKAINHEERAALLKRMIRQVVDEEIDRAVQLRKNKCIRCIHGRFYDECGTAHINLPLGVDQAQNVGCDKLRPDLRRRCRRFAEASSAISLEDYLNEMTLLYELRDVIDRFEEIWIDYFKK
jgi:hypothetical protein